MKVMVILNALVVLAQRIAETIATRKAHVKAIPKKTDADARAVPTNSRIYSFPRQLLLKAPVDAMLAAALEYRFGKLANGAPRLLFVQSSTFTGLGVFKDLVSKASDKLGSMLLDLVHTRWMTVVCPNGTTVVSMPAKLGDAAQRPDNIQKIAHELQHVLDFMGDLKQFARYFNPAFSYHRGARIEARGSAAGGDAIAMLGVPAPVDVEVFDAEWRKTYLVSKLATRLAKKNYRKLMAAHDDGRLATLAGRIVAEELRAIEKQLVNR